MVSRRPVPVDKLILVCPPYVCVPYEPRKRFVCAYCFKEYKYLEDRYKKEQEALAAQQSAGNAETGATAPNDVHELVHGGAAEKPLDQSVAGLHIEENGSTESKKTPPEVPPMPESIVNALTMCTGCEEVWYCNEECRLADLPEHGHYECRALKAFDIPWAKDYYSYCDDLVTDIRLLIRALNKKRLQEEAQSNEFHEEYQLLISNMNCYPEDVLASLRSIVQYTNYLVPDEAFVPEDELLEIYCRHRVNMFGIWANGGECLGYGVYPRASYFNHSCWPNTTFYKNPELKIPHMNFLTVWPIEKEGEEVCISYIDISTGLMDRRGTLLDKYFFHCTCERCMLQELSPQEPDPYYVYWAPAPPPDGLPPDGVAPNEHEAQHLHGDAAASAIPHSDTPIPHTDIEGEHDATPFDPVDTPTN